MRSEITPSNPCAFLNDIRSIRFLQIFIAANTAMKVPRTYVYFLRGICWNGKFRRKIFHSVARQCQTVVRATQQLIGKWQFWGYQNSVTPEPIDGGCKRPIPAKRGPADDLNVCLRNSTQLVFLCLYASLACATAHASNNNGCVPKLPASNPCAFLNDIRAITFLQIFIAANTAIKVPRPYIYFLRGICWNGKYRKKIFHNLSRSRQYHTVVRATHQVNGKSQFRSVRTP